MATGKVKWFNGNKRFGFIAPDDGGRDIFVHISAVEKAQLEGLPEGARIRYDIGEKDGKTSAVNLMLLD